MLSLEKPCSLDTIDEKFNTVLLLKKNKARFYESGLRTEGYFKKSYKNKPLISIITVVFNGEKYIESAIQSVINQNYDNVEYIIIDGGSNDSTVKIIKKYINEIDYVVSERDNGIYDAMNKGITLCNGNIIGILNSDDYYSDDIFNEIVNPLKYNNYDLIHGDIRLIYNRVTKIHSTRKMNYLFKYITTPFKHPSLFIKKDVYKKIGLFDLNFKIVSDYDFMLRCINNNVKVLSTKKVNTNMRMVGVTSGNNNLSSEKELKKLYKKHLNSLFLSEMFIFIKKVIKVLKK